MKFDSGEWTNDMITRIVAGAFAGVVGAAMLPHPALGRAALVGGLSGLAFGVLFLPVQWLLRRFRDRHR